MNAIKIKIFAFLIFSIIACVSCGNDKGGSRGCNNAAPLPPMKGKTLPGDQTMYDSYVFSVEKLKEQYNDVVVLDARTKGEYEDGHLPNAVHAYWTDWSNMEARQGEKGWAHLIPFIALKDRLGALGIDGKKPVIIYIDTSEGWGEDGRQLWALRYFGLKNTFILNGGIKAWIASGGNITTTNPDITAVPGPEPGPDHTLFASTDDVAGNAEKLKILDVREYREFAGKKAYGEKCKGRIPGSKHIWYRDFYNTDGTLQAPAQIRARLQSIGFKTDDDIICYCTGGIRSGLTTIALRIAGYSKARNYCGGFSEWTGTGQNVDTGVMNNTSNK